MSALRVPRHMLGGFCTVLMGDLGIPTLATRVKLSAHFDQAFYVHAPAFIAHARTQYFPPAHGLRFIAIDAFRPRHATATATDHGTAFHGALNAHLVALAVGTWMWMHKLPLSYLGHFHFGSNQ